MGEARWGGLCDDQVVIKEIDKAITKCHEQDQILSNRNLVGGALVLFFCAGADKS
jgi:hypothetical protein